jgi:hypothetical protein
MILKHLNPLITLIRNDRCNSDKSHPSELDEYKSTRFLAASYPGSLVMNSKPRDLKPLFITKEPGNEVDF